VAHVIDGHRACGISGIHRDDERNVLLIGRLRTSCRHSMMIPISKGLHQVGTAPYLRLVLNADGVRREAEAVLEVGDRLLQIIRVWRSTFSC
jgi:hypothetical protein